MTPVALAGRGGPHRLAVRSRLDCLERMPSPAYDDPPGAGARRLTLDPVTLETEREPPSGSPLRVAVAPEARDRWYLTDPPPPAPDAGDDGETGSLS